MCIHTSLIEDAFQNTTSKPPRHIEDFNPHGTWYSEQHDHQYSPENVARVNMNGMDGGLNDSDTFVSDVGWKTFVKQACPIQSTIHSCYYRKSIASGKKAEQQIFHMQTNSDVDSSGGSSSEGSVNITSPGTTNSTSADAGCVLREFHPMKFLHTIRGRTLALVGDSLTLQMFEVIVCSLHHAKIEAKYSIR